MRRPESIEAAGARYARQRERDRLALAKAIPAKTRGRLLDTINASARALIEAIGKLDERTRDEIEFSLRCGGVDFGQALQGVAALQDGARKAKASLAGQDGPNRHTDALALFVAKACTDWEMETGKVATYSDEQVKGKTVLKSPVGIHVAKMVRAHFDGSLPDSAVATVLKKYLVWRRS